MSTGSHSGQLFQTLPTHMGAWSKYVLGWIEPKVLDYGSRRADADTRPGLPARQGTESAVRINLPAKRVEVGQPHSGELAWWSSNDQSWADVRLTRSIDVPDGQRRPVLELERLPDRGVVGLRLHRGVDRRRHDLDAVGGASTRPEPWSPPTRTPTAAWPTSAIWRTG